MTDQARRTSLLVALVGGTAFVVLATWLVPWHPVPGGIPAPVSPGSVFTQHQIQRAQDFSRWASAWSLGSLVVSLLVACWFGFGRGGPWLVARTRGPWWLRVVALVALLAIIGRVVTLPFALLLRVHVRDYGLSHQSWWGFAVDQAIGELVAIVTTSLGLLLVMGCARRWPRVWPAVAGVLLGGLVLAGSFVYPVLVEPLFNNFTPLPAGTLRTQILRLAEEQHVKVQDVLVADASRRTTTLNAYVSGYGGTRRVVIYDNLVNGLPEDETLSVVAHELGHARHNDVLTGSLLGAAGAMFGVGLLGLLVGRRRTGRGQGVGDPASVPLVLALVAIGTLLASPVENGISRQIETRADVDALEATHDPQAFVAMQKELAVRSLADPTPPAWLQFWFGSHPTTLTRVAIARGEESAGAGASR